MECISISPVIALCLFFLIYILVGNFCYPQSVHRSYYANRLKELNLAIRQKEKDYVLRILAYPFMVLFFYYPLGWPFRFMATIIAIAVFAFMGQQIACA